MARFDVPAVDGTIQGTTGDDVYVIDAARVGDMTIVDGGGDDLIILEDEFASIGIGSITSSGDGLVLDTGASGTVTFTSGSGGPAEIEHLTRVLRPGTSEELRLTHEIVVSPALPGDEDEPVIYAGTSGDDVIDVAREPLDFEYNTWAFGGAGRDTITAEGNWSARVDGGSGDDRLISRNNGTMFAHGGDGDDVLRNVATAGGGLWGYGGAGNDTLIGGESFRNDLHGEEGDDRLRAGGEGAWLDGGAGNDRLSGGAGEDWFAFDASKGAGLGRDRIKGYDEDADTLYFVGVDRSDVEVSHANGNTVITYLDEGWIAVRGVTLTEDELVFHDDLTLAV